MTKAAETAELIRQSRVAVKQVAREALRSPKAANDLLVKAGICERTKHGVRLAKPYR